VVSQAEAQGRVEVVALSEIQGKHFEELTIVIAENVGGMEDIPVTCLPAYNNHRKGVLTMVEYLHIDACYRPGTASPV